MALNRLLLLQAVITFLSFLAFVGTPATIPASFGIPVGPKQYILSYLLGANELALTYLSLAARKLNDPPARRAIVTFFIVFHAAVGLFGLYSVWQGASMSLLGNVALRVLIVGLFYYYGLLKPYRDPVTA